MNARGSGGWPAGQRSGPPFAPSRQDLKKAEKALARASELAGLGRPGEAEPICRQVLAAMPRLAAAHFVAGEIEDARTRPERAVECYRRATALDPSYFPAWLNLGVCLRGLGDIEGAVAAYERAIKIDPRSAQAYNNLASAYVSANEFDKAIVNFERALKLRPGSLEIRRGLAQVYRRVERIPQAIEMVRSALEIDDADSGLWEILGSCLQIQGQFDEAEAAFVHALELDPQHADAHFNLAMMKRSRDDEGEALASIEALLSGDPEVPKNEVGLHFAAARLHERQGNFDAAFDHYLTANSLRAEKAEFAQEGTRNLFDAIIATFTPELFEKTRYEAASDSDKPVFIVGMPRSGTTLTEQIVASHPDVGAAGELMTLRNLMNTKSRIDPARGLFILPDEEEAARIVGTYLGALTEGRASAVRITDKLPFNFLSLGMIHLLFPNAKIIHCRREPIDTCLSCFCQNFRDNLSFTLKLDSLGYYYGLYDRLMRHWKSVLPHPILDVDYERVTGEPEAAIREIIAFCGLPWDEACLAPHETRRSVRTASIWQVRQPIYRSSVAKWRQFDRHLGPLKAALGDLFEDPEEAAGTQHSS